MVKSFELFFQNCKKTCIFGRLRIFCSLQLVLYTQETRKQQDFSSRIGLILDAYIKYFNTDKYCIYLYSGKEFTLYEKVITKVIYHLNCAFIVMTVFFIKE